MGEVYHAAYRKADSGWTQVSAPGLYKPEDVPVPSGGDWIGCGDGFFTSLLGENQASVVGLDNSNAFLRHARANYGNQPNLEFQKGDVRRLPFDDASVDIVWSAHSMHSYPDVPHCLAEFRRVLRPGGLLAVLESDNVHSVMLSWPPDLELTVRQAEHQKIGDEDSYIGTYFPRFAVRLLGDAGFEIPTRQYFLINRFAPAAIFSSCD